MTTKFAAAIAGALLSFASVNSAESATLTYNFNVPLQPGQSPFGQGQFSGFFTYTAPTTTDFTGQINIDLDQFFVNFGGATTYSITTAYALAGNPPTPFSAAYSGGNFLGVSGGFTIPAAEGNPIDQFGSSAGINFQPGDPISGFGPTAFASKRAGLFWWQYVDYTLQTTSHLPDEEISSTTSIPEPSAVAGLALLGLGFWLGRKRVASAVS